MSKRITEKALVLPSLLIMARNNGRAKTTLLNKELRKILEISGEDLRILSGRKDDKFSQKVRNLKSHDTFEDLGFAKYNTKDKMFEITQKGITALDENKDSLFYFIKNNFSANDSLSGLEDLTNKQTDLEVFDEDIIISEGKSEYILTKKNQRSGKLRKKAIEHYKDIRGTLYCDICNFDFEKTYGAPAKGYIEMHHLKPVYMYKDGDVERTIMDAIINLLPVCANCHRVIHRRKPPYEIKDVRGFYENNLI